MNPRRSTASTLSTRAAGAGAERRRSASTSAMPAPTPIVKTMIGTRRWTARLQSPSPTKTPRRMVLPLMCATNRSGAAPWAHRTTQQNVRLRPRNAHRTGVPCVDRPERIGAAMCGLTDAQRVVLARRSVLGLSADRQFGAPRTRGDRTLPRALSSPLSATQRACATAQRAEPQTGTRFA
jgi:hypothetical protein